MDKKPLVLLSDLHTGSSLAPFPPDLELTAGGTHALNAAQQWLWDCWQKFIAMVPRGSTAIICGDVLQGTNMKDGALIAYKGIDQVNAAVAVLSLLVGKCAKTYLIFGTEWHEFVSGELLLQVWQLLNRDFPGKVEKPEQELWLEWNGKLLHAAHHRAISNSPIGMGTPLAGSLVRMLANAPMRGGIMPDIVVRGHAHDPGFLRCRAGLSIGLAGWQLKSAYSWRHAPEAVAPVGGTILRVWNEEVVVCQKLFLLDKPTIHQA